MNRVVLKSDKKGPLSAECGKTAGTPEQNALPGIRDSEQLKERGLPGVASMAALFAGLVFASEFSLMFVLQSFPPLIWELFAVLDALAITLLVFPLVYFLLYRPLDRHIAERKQTEKALRKINRALGALMNFQRSLSSAEREEELLGAVCRIIVETGEYPFAWVGFAEHDEKKGIRPMARNGTEDGYLHSLEMTWEDRETGRGPAGKSIRSGQPCIVKDIMADPEFSPWREAARKRGFSSIIGLPLSSAGTTFGALLVYSYEVDAFDAEETKLLMELANTLSYGIMALRSREKQEEVERSIQETKNRIRKQNRVFVELAKREYLELGGLDETFREITQSAANHLKVDRAEIWLFNDDRTRIQRRGLHESIPGRRSGTPELEETNYPRYLRALEEERVIAAPDVASDSRIREFLEAHFLSDSVVSILDAPIRVGGRLIGFIRHECQGEKRHWTVEEESFAASMADVVSLAVETNTRKRAETALRETLDNLEKKVEERTEALKKSKENAEEANRLKDKFVSLVAHDLRSPFTALLGYLEMILSDTAHPPIPRHKEIIDRVLHNGRSLLEMIDKLLKIARLQNGRLQPQFKFFDAYFISQNARNYFLPLARQKGVEIINDVPRRCRLYGDLALFTEVVNNLVSNAVKFCPEGGCVTIFAPPEEGGTVAVRDTGAGVPPEFLPDLFRHDIKTSKPGTKGEKGNGLGLPFCGDIMKAHEGRLEVETTEGKGSTFYARLPFVRPTILMVEDEEVTVEIVSRYLKPLGVEIVHCFNGEDAKIMMKNIVPHLILLDLRMPGLGGFSLLESIRENPATKETPVIIFTVDEQAATRDQAFLKGANDFITKPFVENEFVPRVRRFLV